MFPRLPNVVSHRGHRVKILATIRQVPEPEPEEVTTVSLKARVLVLAPQTMGENENVSRLAQLWGEAPAVTATFPSIEFPSLPFTIHTIVPRGRGDDHLGEGPDYQALVNVTTSSGNGQAAPKSVDGGGEGGGAAGQPSSFDANGLYIIEFMSK
jgi:hypothetical protein